MVTPAPRLMDIRDPRLQALLDYWRRCRPGDRLPGRGHIDPVEIPRLLPHLVLLDVQREPLGFRHRLVGTYVVEQIGADPTGLPLSEVAMWAELGDVLRRVVERGEPVATQGPAGGRLGSAHHAEWLLLPLAGDGIHVDMVLAGLVISRAPG